MTTKSKRTVQDIVTDRIIAELEQGVAPWRKPWRTVPGFGAPCNVTSKKPYRGINAFITALSLFDEPWWITKKQAHQRGLRILDDEFRRSTPVVLWKPIERKCAPDTPGAVWSTNQPVPCWVTRSMMLRFYDVWNVQQLEEYEADPTLGGLVPAVEPLPEVERLDGAERAIAEYVDNGGPKLSIRISDRAYYSPSQDQVVLPVREQFDEPAGFYSVAFHELGHSTGHPDRLDRKELHGVESTFGSEPYAREELVAEMTAAMCMARLDLEPRFEQSASYVQNWLRALDDDRNLIINAAQAAQKATDWIFQSNQEVTAS